MATILWFSPHADDDTLTFGAGISNHVSAGHRNIVVLCSDGSNSAVRQQIGLEAWAFADARDDEFRRATRRLGVRHDHAVVSRHRCEDGQLTVVRSRRIILAALDEFPGSWVKTMSNRPASGRHSDHVNLGQAAVDLFTAGTITNLRLYVEPYALNAFRTATGLNPTREAGSQRVVDAVDEYQRVDEQAGVWGIGYRSVPSFFDAARADPASWYHVP